MAATAPPADSKKGQKEKKNRWVQLQKEWNGKPAGERIRLEKTAADELISTQAAIESTNPEKKLINKAVAKVAKQMGVGYKAATEDAVRQILKGVGGAKSRFPGAHGPATGGWDVNTGSTVNKDTGEITVGPSGCPISTGVGMGKWLTDLADHGRKNYSAESAARMDKEWGPRGSFSSEKLFGGETKAALAESSGATGGYTVPTEYAMRLMQLVVQQSVIRPRATIMPMGARSIQIPTLDVTTPQPAGTTAYLGGLAAFWAEEAAGRTETEPKFRQIELVAHELSGYTKASNTLLADNAVALDALLTRLFPQAISWYSDYAFLQGTGAGQPTGILNAPCSVVVNRGTASTFKLADAATMLSKLLTTSMGSAVWIMSQTMIPQLVQLADASGKVVFIPNMQSPSGGAAQPIPMSLFGLPILFTEKLPPLGTKGDVMLVDPSYYLIGDRMSIEVASSIHVAFLNNQTTWRFLARVDGQPWLKSAITLADGSTLVSPFVVLN